MIFINNNINNEVSIKYSDGVVIHAYLDSGGYGYISDNKPYFPTGLFNVRITGYMYEIAMYNS